MLLDVALAAAVVLAACGDDDPASTTAAAGSSSSAASSSSSTATGAGGAGGGSDFTPRPCGSGLPCRAGSTCSYWGIESGVDCECDDSGHYFCDAWAGGGAPPSSICDERSVCAPPEPTPCTQTNGYCTRSCSCDAGCTMECDGDGPAEGDPGYLCDADFCADPYWGYGGCSISEPSCEYELACQPEPTITGACPIDG